MSQVHDPLVSLLFFSQVGANPVGEAKKLYEPWRKHGDLALVKVEVHNPNDNQTLRQWGGTTPIGLRCEMKYYQEHDTHLLRIRLNYQGAQEPAKWGEMRQLLDKIIHDVASQYSSQPEVNVPRPWAATLLYHAIVPANSDAPSILRLINDANLAIPPQERADNTRYGYLWRVGNEQTIQQAKVSYYQRTLLLITKELSAANTQQIRHKFLDPIQSGLALIELDLHKGKHHIREHEKLFLPLQTSRRDLQQRILRTLAQLTQEDHQPSHSELSQIERRLMYFLAYKGQGEILLISLNNNIYSFNVLIQEFNLLENNNSHYRMELTILNRGCEEIKSALSYANSTQESAQTITEIQRSMEALQRERIGYLLNIAAALLAGITIFNSFLDIWALLIRDTPYTMPSPHIRLSLSFMAAWGASACTYLFMKQHKRMTIFALSMILLAVLLAYVSTMWAMG